MGSAEIFSPLEPAEQGEPGASSTHKRGQQCPAPLYGNQLPHLRLQQGTLFLAFSAGRGRTCSSVGSSIMRHSESPGDTRGCGKDKGTFPAPGVGTFQVLCPSNHPPHHPLHTPLHCSPSPSSWGKAKNASNPRRLTDAGVALSEAGGRRTRARLLTSCPIQGHL